MKQGFVKAAAATPEIRVADTAYNQEKICECILEAEKHRATIQLFTE